MNDGTVATGGTGFVGARGVRRLVSAGHRGRVLAHASTAHRLLVDLPVEIVDGALGDTVAAQAACSGDSSHGSGVGAFRRPPHRPALVAVDAVRMACTRMFVEPGRSVRELGMPQSSVEDALVRAVEWFRGNGYAPEFC